MFFKFLYTGLLSVYVIRAKALFAPDSLYLSRGGRCRVSLHAFILILILQTILCWELQHFKSNICWLRKLQNLKIPVMWIPCNFNLDDLCVLLLPPWVDCCDFTLCKDTYRYKDVHEEPDLFFGISSLTIFGLAERIREAFLLRLCFHVNGTFLPCKLNRLLLVSVL